MLGESVGADRAFAALGMFAGIRPHEIRQMNWEMVNVETGCIRLPASITKTNMTRSIQLEPNVIKWLIPLKNEAPQLALDAACQTNRVMIAGGLEAWPQGVLRHTFASYHVTAFENPGRTALFMHCRTSPDILFRHYFKDTLKSDALKFWQIEP
jgi:integrase